MINITNIKKFNTPWEHFIIKNSFDYYYYETIINKLNKELIKTNNKNDPVYDFADVSDIDYVDDPFWNKFKLDIHLYKDFIYNLYNIKNIKQDKIWIGIHKDKKNFYQGEHTEIKDYCDEVITWQFYTPINNNDSHLGVELLDSNFNTIKQMPYIRNISYIFKASKNSWHKVSKFNNLNNSRFSIMVRFFIKY